MIKVSVIIPAFNEEKFIAKTIESLQENKNIEIVVVDNGSTDRTSEISRSLGARVLQKTGGTIASVRNLGAKESRGEILVFIDADVWVSRTWHANMPAVIEELDKHKMLVTGSRCLAPKSKSSLNRYWYSRLGSYDSNYVNSGHLITTRTLFERIGGFSESLETAEDYDFCQRAKSAGAEIRNNRKLEVIHEGYPDSVSGFILREKWHGSQDVSDWNSFLESRIAWIAAANVLLFVLMAVVLVTGQIAAILIYLIIMYLLSFMLSIYKFRAGSPGQMLITPFFFYLYICGRSLSILDRVLK